MERLHYIDEHHRLVHASPEAVWHALGVVMPTMTRELPRWLSNAWGLEHTKLLGSWPHPGVGDTMVVFSVAESEPPNVLVLRGSHRFSTFELRFQIQASSPEWSQISALTFAEFPGLKGQIYKTLVIRSRGHAVVAKRMLKAIAARAERPTAKAVYDG